MRLVKRRTILATLGSAFLGCAARSPAVRHSAEQPAERQPPARPESSGRSDVASKEAHSEASAQDEVLRELLATQSHPAAVVSLELESSEFRWAAQGGADPFSVALRPASTVKPLLYTDAIDAGLIDASTTFECSGSMPDNENFRCFGVHGRQDAGDAIASSCNTFAWEVIDKMGYERVFPAYKSWGFGRKTGAVEWEAAGVLPHDIPADPLEARERARLRAFGHDDFRVTLFQLARAYKRLSGKLTSAPEKYAVIREGLRKTAESGTGVGAKVEGLPIWSKTGSGEHSQDAVSLPGAQMNGWFVALVPAEKPQQVIAVHVLGGGGAMKTAVPLMRKVLLVSQ